MSRHAVSRPVGEAGARGVRALRGRAVGVRAVDSIMAPLDNCRHTRQRNQALTENPSSSSRFDPHRHRPRAEARGAYPSIWGEHPRKDLT
jgi:hypothetical protein